jgi:hypothetical protein
MSDQNRLIFFFPSSKVIGTVWMLLIAGLSYSFSVVAKKDESIAKHLIFYSLSVSLTLFIQWVFHHSAV